MANNNRQEQREVSSNVKISINVIIALVVTVAFLLFQFFVLDDIIAKARTTSYWISKVLSGLATFTIMVSLANTTEESRKKRDKEFHSKLDALDTHYNTVFGKGEIDNLETFVFNMNVANKYNVYVTKIKNRIKKVQRFVRNQDRKKELIEELEEKLMRTPEEVWEDENVKFNMVTVDLLFSGIYDIEKSDKENDLHLHRGRYGVQKLGWKIMSIIAFGFMAGDLYYHFNAFNRDMIVPLLFKIATILMSVYSGVCFGYFMMDKIKVNLRKKLRILSKFRCRQDAPVLDLSVAVRLDSYVSKVYKKNGVEFEEEKSPEQSPLTQEVPNACEPSAENVEEVHKENALKKTYNETFGSGTPVKIGKFGVKLVQNMMGYNSSKSD